MCPSAHPQSAGSASVCNWRTESKTAAPSLSCICHNCDFMEQSENATTRFDWLFSHTPAIVPVTLSLSVYLLFLCQLDGYFSYIFNLSSAIALPGIFMLAHFTVYNIFHPHFTHLSCKAVVHPVGHQGHCLGSSNWLIRGVWVTAVPKTDASDRL